MKKPFLLLALLAGATSLAQAQTAIPAGTVSLGASIGYNRKTQNNATNNNFQIAPSVGYFVADNFALGLTLGYNANWSTFESNPGRELDAATILQLGAYGQYYKMFTDQFGVLGTLGAGYQRYSTPVYIGPDDVVDRVRTAFYANLTPGIIFFPVPKFGISASVGGLGYGQSSDKDNDADKESSFGASFGLSQLNFSGTYYFGR